MKSLEEVKSSDRKTNILMYIIEKAETVKGSDLMDLDCNIIHIMIVLSNIDYEFLCKYPLGQLNQDLNDVRKM